MTKESRLGKYVPTVVNAEQINTSPYNCLRELESKQRFFKPKFII